MRHILLFTLLIFSVSANAQCPGSTMAGNDIFANTNIITTWAQLQECFAPPCVQVPACDWGHVVQAIPDASFAGQNFRVYATSANGSNLMITVMSRQCDTILGQGCPSTGALAFVDFHSTTESFSIWFQTESPTDTISFQCFAGGQGFSAAQCAALPLQTQPQTRPITYRAIDLMHGTLSQPSETIPHGLSLRSNGMKVIKQGVTGGLSLLFVAFAIAYIIRHIWQHGDI